MEASDLFPNIAEIAAAFAGFSALVTAVGGRSEKFRAFHDILRLRIVIAASVKVVVVALVPVGLMSFDLTPETIWRLSAILFLLLNVGVIISFVRSYQPVQGMFPADRVAVVLSFILEILIIGSLLICIVGVSSGTAYPFYTAALIAKLSQAAFVFVRFVGSAFQLDNLTKSD